MRLKAQVEKEDENFSNAGMPPQADLSSPPSVVHSSFIVRNLQTPPQAMDTRIQQAK
jgi:hypothetical protein